MKKLLLAVGLMLISVLYVSADTETVISTATDRVDIYSDSMTYDSQTDIVISTGNVKAVYRDMELFADSLEYIRSRNLIKARGDITFKKRLYSLTAKKLDFDIVTSTGVVFEAQIKSHPLFVYSDKVIIRTNDEIYMPKGDITTCSHKPPHYHFGGQKMKLKLNKRFSAFNTIMYIRGIPAFYYPYYTKKLGPQKLELSFDIGSSSRNGDFFKAKAAYPFTENSKTYMGLDLMSKRGVGFQAGHTYSTGKGYSDIDVYLIRDKEYDIDRGRINARGWQEIRKYLNVRYRTEYTTSFDFNYEYDERAQEYKKNDLYYQLGLEYTRSIYQISIYQDKREQWSGTGYDIQEYVLPGIKLQLFPYQIMKNTRFSGQVEYENEYLAVSDRWQSAVSWLTKLERSYRFDLSRYYYMTLLPGLGFDGEYRTSLRRFGSMYLKTQHGLMRKLFLDADYKWRRSLEYPYSITQSDIGYKVSYRPYSGLYLYTKSSYDFRDGVKEPVGDFFSQLRMNYKMYMLYVRNRYDYHADKIREWLYELDINRFSETRVKYNYLYPARLEIGQRFNIRRFPFTITLGTRLYISKNGGLYGFDDFIEKSFSVNYNMHCWDSEVRFISRGDETVFWILFNISAFPESKIGMYGNLKYDDYRYHRE